MRVVEIRIITDNFAKTLGAISHSLVWNQFDEVTFKFSSETPGVVFVRFELRADEAPGAIRYGFETGPPS